jgi:hypothetical protein
MCSTNNLISSPWVIAFELWSVCKQMYYIFTSHEWWVDSNFQTIRQNHKDIMKKRVLFVYIILREHRKWSLFKPLANECFRALPLIRFLFNLLSAQKSFCLMVFILFFIFILSVHTLNANKLFNDWVLFSLTFCKIFCKELIYLYFLSTFLFMRISDQLWENFVSTQAMFVSQ